MITAEELAKFPDTFNGDDAHLARCIEALLSLDAKNALVPHGIGGHARGLLSAAMHRLAIQSRAAGAVNPAAEAIQYHNAVGPIDAIYAAFSAMDNNDTPLEEWPQRAIDALAFAGWAVVPYDLPFAILGEAGMTGVFETGNPKHGWDWLVAKTRIGPHGPPAATTQPPTTIRVDVEQIGSCELDVRDGVAYMPAVTVQDIVSKSCLKPQPPKDADCPSSQSPGDSLSLHGAAGQSVSRPPKDAGAVALPAKMLAAMCRGSADVVLYSELNYPRTAELRRLGPNPSGDAPELDQCPRITLR